MAQGMLIATPGGSRVLQRIADSTILTGVSVLYSVALIFLKFRKI